MPSIRCIRLAAKEIFSAALLELYPKIRLCCGDETAYGFYCDFFSPEPFQDHFLILIEEKMREIIKRDEPIKISEMVPSNAAAFFRHLGQPLLAQHAAESDLSLVSVLQIGSFADLSSPISLASTALLPAFKLRAFRTVNGKTRLLGAAAASEKELKELLKRTSLAEESHYEIGVRCQLFSRIEEKRGVRWVWLPAGRHLLEELRSLWTRLHREKNLFFVAFPPEERLLSQEERVKRLLSCAAHLPLQSSFADLDSAAVSAQIDEEGLLQTTCYTSDCVLIQGSGRYLEGNAISSLQLVIKFINMLYFDYRIALFIRGKKERDPLFSALCQLNCKEYEEFEASGCSRIEVQVPDGIGRYWCAAAIEWRSERSKQKEWIVHSLFSSMERTVALLLEQRESKGLPFWLTFEQVRILLVDPSAESYSLFVKRELEAKGYRTTLLSTAKESLREQIIASCDRQVPFTIVVGRAEESEKSVDVRRREKRERSKMSLTDFLTLLQEERLENQ